MIAADAYPHLRRLRSEPVGVQISGLDGQTVEEIFQRMDCPLRLGARRTFFTDPSCKPIFDLMDGQHSLEEIAKVSRASLADVTRLVSELDENFLLQNDRFAAEKTRVEAEFRLLSVRPAMRSGLSYPESPEALLKHVEACLSIPELADPNPDLAALAVPHINYERGDPCYGIGYGAMRELHPDIIVVIGPSHSGPTGLVHLTRKDFECPFGLVETDRDFVDEIAKRYGVEAAFAEELAHRDEHTIEIHLPYLHHLVPHAKIVPILLRSFKRFSGGWDRNEDIRPPFEDPDYLRFVEALTDVCRSRTAAGQRICFVASVDMSHVGTAFKPYSEDRISDAFLDQVRESDLRYLDLIRQGDERALFDHVAAYRDRTNICGFGTMITLLDVFRRLGLRYSAQVHDYRQAVDRAGDCAVTFAAVSFASEAKR